jgi:drug/metabolite transporter (DMT)-like permease
MTKNKVKGHTAVFISNIIFGLNIPIMKALLSDWMTPLGLMASRALFALILFWIVSMFVPREHVAAKDLLIIALGGIMGFVVSQFLTAVSLQYTTPVYFSLILAMSPMVVMLLAALLLKEPITRQKVLGVCLGIAGAGLLVLKIDNASASGRNNLWGVVLAIISITAYSIYLIIMRSVSLKYSAVTQMKWMFLVTSLILVPMGLNEVDQQRIFTSAITWQGLMELGFVIVLATSVGYFLMPFGMRYLRATTVSVYMNLQPVVASVAAICVGQDTLTWEKPVAAILVIVGAFIVSNSRAKVNS